MNRLDDAKAVISLINGFYDPLIEAGFVRQEELAAPMEMAPMEMAA
jgi:hypothetical protein